MSRAVAAYWDDIARKYQNDVRISCQQFHLGPLIADAREFHLLPAAVQGLQCLELGCGAGQNSVFLAARGAHCTAIDVSAQQLAHGQRLAHDADVQVDFICADLDNMSFLPDAGFDLVHSVYALPFVRDPAAVIREVARCLRPGGQFLLTTAHPLFAGEWLEVDDGEHGVFITDYWHPAPDERTLGPGKKTSCQPAPICDLVAWLRDANLLVRELLEPHPLTIADADAGRTPYDSDAWRALYPQLCQVPAVVVILALKPV